MSIFTKLCYIVTGMAVPVCTPTSTAGIRILPFFSIIWRYFTIWANLVDVGSLGYFNVYFLDYLDTLLATQASPSV